MKTSISPLRSIITRYLGPTNSRGSRIVADAGKACRLTLSWDYSLEDNIEANHKAAADALRAKMGWTGGHYGPTHSGQLEDGRFVHVMTWGA